ncbi:MAG TPA: CDP-diacylglycerol--glycerol-3-phosphate 3-phosphatidyltransferase [Ruminiclostridium sp.]|jgi:cardiolipin synthase|nr:CDP-diacylglycerol--glycerol-3-phosphate 3-phosphatidyltransferase [Ruminiclostridium sp.]
MNGFFKNIPNMLTLLRLVAVPVFAGFLNSGRTFEAAAVFLGAEFTDVLDGFIARRYNLITTFGKVADPFADKLMQLTALFLLAKKQLIYSVIPWFVLVKDLLLIIAGLYVIKNKKKVDVSSKWFGKLTSVLLFVSIMLIFMEAPRILTDALFLICVAMALLSGIMYARSYFRQLRMLSSDSPQ